jgi:amino-acid N-acetyltransferase
MSPGSGNCYLLAGCHTKISPRSISVIFGLKGKRQVIGVVGLEVLRPLALLRSLAIDPLFRNRGLGSELTQQAEKYADSLNIQALYLLTTTAEGFFAKRGYQKVPRETLPNQIQGTAEFRSLCPVTVVCMVKFLTYPSRNVSS